MVTATAQTQQSSPTDEEVAAAIALILAGQAPEAGTPLAAIAALLGLLPDAPDVHVRERIARLVVRDQFKVPEASGALGRAYLDNISYRAHYAIAAVRRVGQKVAGGEDLADAVRGEATYLGQHLEASRERVAGAKLNDATAEKWGPVLSWQHPGKTHTHRPAHVAAAGANFDIRNPPKSTEGLPATLPHCECTPGPPIEGARMLR